MGILWLVLTIAFVFGATASLVKSSGNGPFAIPTLPALGTSVAQSASADTFGTYVQMIASTGEADYITGLVFSLNSTSQPAYFAAQIGTGSGGAETLVGQCVSAAAYSDANASQRLGGFIPIVPWIPIAASTRIAVATASNVASALAWRIHLVMQKQSEVVDAGLAEQADLTKVDGTALASHASGMVPADVRDLLGTAWLTPATAGTPDVNVKLWNGLTTVALPLTPTTAGRTLDVSATGEAGLDFDNIHSTTTITLADVVVTAGTNKTALTLTGNGTGHGLLVDGGSTSGVGAFLRSSSTDYGLVVKNTNANGNGAALFICDTQGYGMNISGSGAAFPGLNIVAANGNGVTISCSGASRHGVSITGGTSGTSDALKLIAGSGGVGLRCDTATFSGAVTLSSTLTISGTTSLAAITTSGTVTFNAFTVSGATTLTGAVTATNASNDIRGITVSSIGNNVITAASIATDAVNEIADGVWDEAQSGHTTAGTFGKFLDVEVSSRLATASYTAPDNTGIAAIQAKTDLLSFTVSGFVDANVQYVNDIQVTGTGQPGNEWGPT